MQIEDEEDAGDAAVPVVDGVVGVGAASPADAAAFGLLGQADVAGGGDAAVDVAEVGDVAEFEGGEDLRVFLDDFVEGAGLGGGDGGLVFG